MYGNHKTGSVHDTRSRSNCLFFENAAGEALTIKGGQNHRMLIDFFSELMNTDKEDIWFPKDLGLQMT